MIIKIPYVRIKSSGKEFPLNSDAMFYGNPIEDAELFYVTSHDCGVTEGEFAGKGDWEVFYQDFDLVNYQVSEFSREVTIAKRHSKLNIKSNLLGFAKAATTLELGDRPFLSKLISTWDSMSFDEKLSAEKNYSKYISEEEYQAFKEKEKTWETKWKENYHLMKKKYKHLD